MQKNPTGQGRGSHRPPPPPGAWVKIMHTQGWGVRGQALTWKVWVMLAFCFRVSQRPH